MEGGAGAGRCSPPRPPAVLQEREEAPSRVAFLLGASLPGVPQQSPMARQDTAAGGRSDPHSRKPRCPREQAPASLRPPLVFPDGHTTGPSFTPCLGICATARRRKAIRVCPGLTTPQRHAGKGPLRALHSATTSASRRPACLHPGSTPGFSVPVHTARHPPRWPPPQNPGSPPWPLTPLLATSCGFICICWQAGTQEGRSAYADG